MNNIKCPFCGSDQVYMFSSNPETNTGYFQCTKCNSDFFALLDNVNHPAHYTQGGIECINALAAATTGLEGIEAVCTANAIKYLWRWKYKNGVEDLKKAIWYIERLIGNENQP